MRVIESAPTEYEPLAAQPVAQVVARPQTVIRPWMLAGPFIVMAALVAEAGAIRRRHFENVEPNDIVLRHHGDALLIVPVAIVAAALLGQLLSLVLTVLRLERASRPIKQFVAARNRWLDTHPAPVVGAEQSRHVLAMTSDEIVAVGLRTQRSGLRAGTVLLITIASTVTSAIILGPDGTESESTHAIVLIGAWSYLLHLLLVWALRLVAERRIHPSGQVSAIAGL